MNLLQRARGGRKGLSIGGNTSSGPYVDPPFWDLDRARWPLSASSLNLEEEKIDNDFEGYLTGAFKANGPVFSLMLVRLQVFSEARFKFRRLGGRRDLFGSSALNLLEHPWPGGTTGDLLARMIMHADLAGNAYVTRVGDRLRLLRPDWVTIVAQSESEPEVAGAALDARIVGYIYEPEISGAKATILLPNQVAHFAPIPDPEVNFRGMSWLTPVLSEISADKATTKHKRKFFENAATPNLAISLDSSVSGKAFDDFVERFLEAHQGTGNAHRPLIIGGGADVKPLSFNFRDLDFKALQGGGETRLASAAGVPPVIVGFSEGLQGSSLNQGNYAAARRRFADGTMRPLWRNVAGSLANLIEVPGDGELWFDEQDISFMREDRKDAADIAFIRAQTIRQLVEAGYEPSSVIAAVDADDYSLLVHTGLFSVQLQSPLVNTPGATPSASTEPSTEPNA